MNRSVPARRAQSMGLGLGDYRLSLKLLAVGAPLAVVAGYLGSRIPAMAAVYPLGGPLGPNATALAAHAGKYLLYYFGFEFLFRGFLLMGIKDAFGPRGANLVQACLATAFHLGKPAAEVIAAFPASLLFGWTTLRTRGIWCAVVVHWIVGVSLDWFLVLAR